MVNKINIWTFRLTLGYWLTFIMVIFTGIRGSIPDFMSHHIFMLFLYTALGLFILSVVGLGGINDWTSASKSILSIIMNILFSIIIIYIIIIGSLFT